MYTCAASHVRGSVGYIRHGKMCRGLTSRILAQLTVSEGLWALFGRSNAHKALRNLDNRAHDYVFMIAMWCAQLASALWFLQLFYHPIVISALKIPEYKISTF